MTSPLRAAVAAGTALAAGGAALAAANVATVRVARPDAPDVPDHLLVSVLLPVRDEAAAVTACLTALLAQQGMSKLEVLVLDDGSSDGTGDIARAVAGADSRVQVLSGGPLPPGWLGKPYACARLAAHATGDVLVFIDADVILHPRAIAAAVDGRSERSAGRTGNVDSQLQASRGCTRRSPGDAAI
jgi:cellulose synthase/poly-beta-1,6-N-acetylglucosamine synthase-like glycosyltransferase